MKACLKLDQWKISEKWNIKSMTLCDWLSFIWIRGHSDVQVIVKFTNFGVYIKCSFSDRLYLCIDCNTCILKNEYGYIAQLLSGNTMYFFLHLLCCIELQLWLSIITWSHTLLCLFYYMVSYIPMMDINVRFAIFNVKVINDNKWESL